MTTMTRVEPAAKAAVAQWQGFSAGLWQKRDQRPRLHPAELHAVRRRRRRSWRRRPRARRRSGRGSTSCSSRSARRACSTSRRSPASITAHAPGYIDRENEIIVGLQTEAPLKRAIMPNGGFRMVAQLAQGLRLRARPARRRDLHQVPQDAQRRGLRRLHRRHPGLPQFAHPDRAARRLRPRPDHRRLPARGALRRRPADRAQEEREGGARLGDVDRGDHPRPRGAERADPRARRNCRRWPPSYGFDISGPAANAHAKPCSGSTSPISAR